MISVQDDPPPQTQIAEPAFEATISSDDFYSVEAGYMLDLNAKIGENKDEILAQVNDNRREKRHFGVDDYYEVSIQSLFSASGAVTAEDGTGTIKVEYPDTTLFFELALVPHFNPTKRLKQVPSAEVASEQIFVAWDVDRFYVEEDEEGEEIYPVTFPAFSLDNPNLVATIELSGDGSYTATSTAKMAADKLTQANIELLYITPIELEPNFSHDLKSKTTSSLQSYPYEGGPHLRLVSMVIGYSGDGSGNSELQMYVEQGDNYGDKFSKRWDYDFKGNKRDLQGSDLLYYHEPDINQPGVTYSFANMPVGPEDWYNSTVNSFPIIKLTSTYHRLFLADDDDYYNKFSNRNYSTKKKVLSTYDFSSKTIYDIQHKISAYQSSAWGTSSDDPLNGGSLRRINLESVDDHSSIDAFHIQNRGFDYELIKKIQQ